MLGSYISRLKPSPKLAVLLFYAVLALFISFPFILHPTSTTIAPPGGDIYSSIAKFEAFKDSHMNPLRTAHFPWISYPQGPPNNIGVDRVSLFSTLLLWQGSNTFGAILAHSLTSLAGMVLSAYITFLFLFRLTRHTLSSALGGMTVGFSPIMYSLIGSNMTYTHFWLFILPLWAFLELSEKGFSPVRTAMACLSIVPAIFWTPYYAFHIVLLASSCLAIMNWFLARQRQYRDALKLDLILVPIWLFLLFAYHYIGVHTASTLIPSRALSDLYTQAAHPLMFLLPGQYSWGSHGNTLLVHLVPRAASTNLYLGLGVLALSVYALYHLRKPSDQKMNQSTLQKAAALAIGGFAICFLFSLPPTFDVFSLRIPTPDYLIAHSVPALRAGQRLVMPMTACLGVLAGIGAFLIGQRFGLNKRKSALYLFIFLAVFLDQWALPPGNTTRIREYQSLAALKSMPAAPVAEYYKGSLITAPPQLPCLLQPQYKMPLVNDCALGRSAVLGVALDEPLCTQLRTVKEIGTRYLILADSDRVTECLSKEGINWRPVSSDDEFKVIAIQ